MTLGKSCNMYLYKRKSPLHAAMSQAYRMVFEGIVLDIMVSWLFLMMIYAFELSEAVDAYSRERAS